MKHKRLLGYGGLGLTLIALGVAFVKPISTSSLLLRTRAADAVNYSQTISRATGSLVTRSNIYYYASTTTSSGTTFYLRNVNDKEDIGNTNYVANLPGSTESPAHTPEITFTSGNATASGESLFEFQNITSISMTSDITSRTLDVFKSDDGSNWTSAGTIASAGGTNSNVAGSKYVKITYSGFFTAKINTITINYSCSYVPPAPKVLDSISVSGATNEFSVGDTFVFDGTVTATYTDSSTYPSADVTSSAVVVDEPDMSEAAEDVEVVISYTEGGITKTDSYLITITEAPAGDVFERTTYSFVQNPSTTFKFQYNLDGYGTYARYNSGSLYALLKFSYTYNESTKTIVMRFVSFEKVGTTTSGNSLYGGYRFSSSDPNTSTTLTAYYSDGVVTTTLYTSTAPRSGPTNFAK